MSSWKCLICCKDFYRLLLLINVTDISTLSKGHPVFGVTRGNVSFPIFPQLSFWPLKILTHEETMFPSPSRAPGVQGGAAFPHCCTPSSGELATCEQIGDILLAWHSPAVRLNISNTAPARLKRRPPERGQRKQSTELARASVITCHHEPEPITLVSRNLSKSRYYNMKIFSYSTFSWGLRQYQVLFLKLSEEELLPIASFIQFLILTPGLRKRWQELGSDFEQGCCSSHYHFYVTAM